MKLLDIIRNGLVGKKITVYKQQQYNGRRRGNEPLHFYTYTIEKPSVIFSFQTFEKVEAVISDVQPDGGVYHRLKVWINDGIELRDYIYSNVEIPFVE